MKRGLTLLVLLAGAAQAEPPRSAIEWLSESLSQPPNFVMSPPVPAAQSIDIGISSSSLDVISRDAVGLLHPDTTGFPLALWGDLGPNEIILLLQNTSPSTLPEVTSLFRQILLAQSDPPTNSGSHSTLLLARIDLLFKMGAIDEAEALIRLAGPDEPEIFRRWFEITLIGHRTIAPCNALKAQPTLSNNVATRAICLARSGDWNAAAITVSLAESLGQISVNEADLLVRFLDPEMFSELPDPGNPVPLDPITFTLRESLALPRPDTPLPLPYLNTDMGLRTPARQRILAAERLVRASAVPPALLFAAYRGARAASSGGAWGRAEVVQALDMALVDEDETKLVEAITEAFIAFADADLFYAFTLEYADALAHYPPGPEIGQIAPSLRRLLLLAERPLAVWAGVGGEDSENVQLATRLASREPISGPSPYSSAIAGAIHDAFSNLTPSRNEVSKLMQRIDTGNFAEVLFIALNLLSKGEAADPRDIHEGLFLLLKLGLDAPARRVATQILLIEPELT